MDLPDTVLHRISGGGKPLREICRKGREAANFAVRRIKVQREDEIRVQTRRSVCSCYMSVCRGHWCSQLWCCGQPPRNKPVTN